MKDSEQIHARHKQVFNNPKERKLIAEMVVRGIKEGDTCPASDCQGILKEIEVSWTDPSTEPWTVHEFQALQCQECYITLKKKEDE